MKKNEKKAVCFDCGKEFVLTTIEIKKEKINCKRRCPDCIRKSYCSNNHGKTTNFCCTAKLINSKPISGT